MILSSAPSTPSCHLQRAICKLGPVSTSAASDRRGMGGSRQQSHECHNALSVHHRLAAMLQLALCASSRWVVVQAKLEQLNTCSRPAFFRGFHLFLASSMPSSYEPCSAAFECPHPDVLFSCLQKSRAAERAQAPGRGRGRRSRRRRRPAPAVHCHPRAPAAPAPPPPDLHGFNTIHDGML